MFESRLVVSKPISVRMMSMPTSWGETGVATGALMMEHRGGNRIGTAEVYVKCGGRLQGASVRRPPKEPLQKSHMSRVSVAMASDARPQLPTEGAANSLAYSQAA